MITPDRVCYGCVSVLDRPGAVCPHCGWDNAVREEEWGRLPATTLKQGRFFVGRPLGAGGFGITYLGRDLTAGEFEDPRRAIKEYFPAGAAIRRADGITVSPSGAEQRPIFEKRRARCQREGRRMAEISANVRNVVSSYDCFDENGTTYIVMEYIEGDTLAEVVKKHGPFGWHEACAKLKPVLLALKHMHAQQFYHMDISPDNIMLRKNPDGTCGEPVILDFGASIEGGASDVTRSRSTITVRDGFTPPEQYMSSFSDMVGHDDEAGRMDEYAVCATLYYAITGKSPTSSTERLTGKKVAPMGKPVPGYIEAAIIRGMSLKSADRYSSMEDLIRALEAPPTRGRKIAIAVAALCVLAATGALLFAMSQQHYAIVRITPVPTMTPEPIKTPIPMIQTGEISDTWDEILAAIDDGTAEQRYAVGAWKPLDLDGIGRINMQLAGFSLDERADGQGNAATTWIAKELLPDRHSMNTNGGWEDSELRAYLQTEVLAAIPDNIRNRIVQVHKKQTLYGHEQVTEDWTWIPDHSEVFGEDCLYRGIFQDRETRVKTRQDVADWWWLRSAGSYFLTVMANGGYTFRIAEKSGGVAIGFCL